MSFRDIIGQETAVRILKDELISQRISHAYLFSGMKGVGKKALALQFARSLNCKEMEADSCDSCLTCRKIDHLNHPDVELIGIEDGNSIKIDQIRELQRNLSYKPYESEWKVFIIEQAELMTDQAANSLLKTLEEPPEYGIIILLAEEINRLLPTVVSRCQQISLSAIPEDIIKNELLNRGLAREKAVLFSRLADGSLGVAQNLSNDEEYLSTRDMLLDFLSRLPDLKRVNILNKTGEVTSLLGTFPFFDLLISWYRDIIMYIQGNNEQLVNHDYLERIKTLQNMYTIDELISIIELISDTRKYIDLNVRKDLALEVMLLKIRAKRV